MVTALVHLKPELKRRVARLARQGGKSFSQEVRDALTAHVEMPVNDAEMSVLAAQAREATQEMLQKLNEAHAIARRMQKKWGLRK